MPLHHFLRLRWSEGFATASDLPPGAIGGQLESHGARCLAEANGAFVVFASHAFPSLGLVWTLVGELYLRNTGRWALFQHSIAAQSPLPSDDPEALLAQAFDRLYGPDDEGHREANVTALYTVLSETTYYDTSNDARALFISQDEAIQELDEERPCIAMEVAAAVLRRLAGSFAGHDLPAGLMVLAGRPHERASGSASEFGERDGAPTAPDAGAAAEPIGRAGPIPKDFDLAFPALLAPPSQPPKDAPPPTPGTHSPARGGPAPRGDVVLVSELGAFVDPTDEEPYALSWLDDVGRFPPPRAVLAAPAPHSAGDESSSATTTQHTKDLVPAEPGAPLGEDDAETEEPEIEAPLVPELSPPVQISRRNVGLVSLGIGEESSGASPALTSERLNSTARPIPAIETTTPQSGSEAHAPTPSFTSGKRLVLALAAGVITVMVVVMAQPPPPELPAPIETPATAPERAPEPLVVAPPPPCYVDDDGDGYAVLVASPSEAHACRAVEAFKEGEDCDDANMQSYPGAPERCDGEDNNCDGAEDGQPGECLRTATKKAKVSINAEKSGGFVDVTVKIDPKDLCEHVKVGYGSKEPNTFGGVLKPTDGTVRCSLASSGSDLSKSTYKSCDTPRYDGTSLTNHAGTLLIGVQCCVMWGESAYCETFSEQDTVSFTAKNL
jgi:hypothetical protein